MEAHRVFVLIAAALGGGIATAALMQGHGMLWASLAAPLGGSTAALGAACFLAARRGHAASANLDAQTDMMVATLRDVAAQATERGTSPDLPAEPAAREARRIA
ncbi:hypothetical protein [Methylobacterium sp. ID0610]|uniref:hypothetical protein n=1 Tax=Methylobacterium carpenticola TaxID=3344827 RepID=UPI0036B7A78D